MIAGARMLPARRTRSVAAVEAVAPAALAAMLGFAPVLALAFADGGYFPTSWGWGGLLASWVIALALVLAPRKLPRLELIGLGALGGLATWTFASALWSSSIPSSMLEGERTLLYALALAAVLLALRPEHVLPLLAGLLAAIFVVSGWGLLTELLPDRLGVAASFGGNRLSGPIGYWNSAGLFASMGVLLSLGLALRSATVVGRACAAAPLPTLLLTLYLTFGRGAWLALAAGLVATVVLDRRRAQAVTVMVIVLAPAAALVAYSSQLGALVSRQPFPVAQIASAGSRALIALVVATIAVVIAAALAATWERRVRVSSRTRHRYDAILLTAGVVLLVAVFVRFGSPVTVVGNAYDDFVRSPPKTGTNLNARLFSFSGNGRPLLWEAARDNYLNHPALGSGAGTFEEYWLQNRTEGMKVRDAHSLYLEVLSELGPVGLALLLAALGAPLVAAIQARRHPLVPFLLGAYVAYLLHAAVDWDWELTAVGVAALLCAGCLLVLARKEQPGLLYGAPRIAALAATVLAGSVVVLTLAGNLALDRSIDAAGRQDWKASAAWAERGRRLAPWSSQPLRRLALSQATAKAARPIFLRAVAKEPNDWELWLELAWASSGAQQQRALAEASRLNPKSGEVAQYRKQLEAEAK